ncbi:MAG TPA: PDZ domain-containing protein [Pirellulales bacterium]|nr:PDZ domain-containing protein [Pirellulales bacterium]
MKLSTSRFPLARFAAAMVLVSASTRLAADEPAAKDVQPQQVEQRAEDLEKKDLEKTYLKDLEKTYLTFSATRLLRLVTDADSLMGVEVIPVDDVLRSHLGLAEGKGLTVTSVAEGGAAAQAGIQANDVLVAIGEQEIAGAEGLHQSLEASLDKAVSLSYIRGGQRRTVELTPTSGVAFALAGNVVARIEEPKYWLGVGLANADDTLRSQLGVPAGEGLVVTGVESDSPAAKAGVMVNDLLLKLDGKPLKMIEELTAQLQELADRSLPLELLRRGKPASLTVTPEKRPPHDENLTPLQGRLTESLAWSSGLILLDNGKQAPPDLAGQVKTLLEQAKQLQASLEALQAAIQSPLAVPASGEEQK